MVAIEIKGIKGQVKTLRKYDPCWDEMDKCWVRIDEIETPTVIWVTRDGKRLPHTRHPSQLIAG